MLRQREGTGAECSATDRTLRRARRDRLEAGWLSTTPTSGGWRSPKHHSGHRYQYRSRDILQDPWPDVIDKSTVADMLMKHASFIPKPIQRLLRATEFRCTPTFLQSIWLRARI